MVYAVRINTLKNYIASFLQGCGKRFPVKTTSALSLLLGDNPVLVVTGDVSH